MPKYSAKPHKTLSKKTVFKNLPFFSIQTDQAEYPNKKKYQYTYMHTPGVSIILPVTDKNELIMVRQYRYLEKRTTLEVVMGGIKKSSPLQAAKDELAEETGYSAKKWKKIGTFTPMNGSCDEIGNIFIAKNLKHDQQDVEEDESEYIKPVIYPIKKVYKMAENGKITCGMSLAALMLAKKHLNIKI